MTYSDNSSYDRSDLTVKLKKKPFNEIHQKRRITSKLRRLTAHLTKITYDIYIKSSQFKNSKDSFMLDVSFIGYLQLGITS